MRNTTQTTRRSVRAFTMIDILVSIAIVGVLIALMLPAISRVHESTRKVICGSNLRQIGMGMSIYAQDRRERLPDSVFLPRQYSQAASNPAYERMDTVWVTRDEFPERRGDLWDGLGLLYGNDYVTASNVYYCPSHSGNFTFDEGADAWNKLDESQEIIVNYLFRGTGPRGSRVLYKIDPRAALVTDTLRSYEDLNHQGGFNVLQAGLAVNWFDDVGDQIAQDILQRDNGDSEPSNTVQNTWGLLDGFPGEQD